MKAGPISEYIAGVAAIRLSTVEANLLKSKQQKFYGIEEQSNDIRSCLLTECSDAMDSQSINHGPSFAKGVRSLADPLSACELAAYGAGRRAT